MSREAAKWDWQLHFMRANQIKDTVEFICAVVKNLRLFYRLCLEKVEHWQVKRHLNRNDRMILRKKVILMVVSCESNRGL